MANNNDRTIAEIVRKNYSRIEVTHVYGLHPTKCPRCNSIWEFVSLYNGVLTVCCPEHKDEKVSVNFLSKELPWTRRDKIEIIKKDSSGEKYTRIDCLYPEKCPECNSTWEFISLEKNSLNFGCPNHKERKYSVKLADNANLIWVSKLTNGLKIFYLFILLVWIAISMYACPIICSDNTSSYSERTVRCQSCGNSYSVTSDNGRKIKYTNRCKKCYDTYKGVQDALDELPRN